MGGNALKVAPTERLLARDYHVLARNLVESLVREFGGRAQAIPAYRSKQDFGDLDVLVEAEMASIEDLEVFAKAFGYAREIRVDSKLLYMEGDEPAKVDPVEHERRRTGRSVMSYDHRASASDTVGFQVDFIQAPAAEFDVSLAYFSYNDLGNLIGRIAHKMGFTYGHRGLILPVRDGTHMVAKIDVSSSLEDCLGFLGYDANRFHEGFEDLEEIFAYAQSTPYFNPEIFLLENRNHTSRTRDRKRPTYMKFLKHLESLPDRDYFQFPEDKNFWLPKAYAHFPGLKEEVAEVMEKKERNQRVREHYNGRFVEEWTGLTGKELGAFMSRFSHHAGGRDGLFQILDEKGPEQLREEVLEFLRTSTTPRKAPASP